MMKQPTLNRRGFVAMAGALTLTGLPVPGFALTGREAENLVNAAVGDINGIISSGSSVDTMVRQFAGVFERYADTAYVAAFALGNSGRAATQTQRRAFSNAFADYLANKYGRRFNEFAGGEIVVQGSRNAGNYIEVQTLADLPGQSAFRVDFHVSDRTGRPAFFNMIVEGVNMLITERTEIGAMLDARGGNLDALIRDLS